MFTYPCCSTLARVLASFLALHCAIAQDLPPRAIKQLEKRPNNPSTRRCSRDYGYPDYNNCRLAIAQLPTWTSFSQSPRRDDACMVERIFREYTGVSPGIPSVQLPLRRAFGSCTVLISGLHSFEELETDNNVALTPSDHDNWWAIIDAAYQINSHCVGNPGVGGQQLAGKGGAIQVSLYERGDSPVETAVTHWIGAYPPNEQVQLNSRPQSSGSVNAQSSDAEDGSSEASSAASNKLAIYCIPGVGRNCILGMVCKPVIKLSKILIGIAMTIMEIGFCSLTEA
ncbi:MAG: hypothetical protein M1835_006942 [Candelina submexicana]|nr:MAG: hypothetical protein M1835_006942 [Candelina submexicana]